MKTFMLALLLVLITSTSYAESDLVEAFIGVSKGIGIAVTCGFDAQTIENAKFKLAEFIYEEIPEKDKRQVAQVADMLIEQQAQNLQVSCEEFRPIWYKNFPVSTY